MPNYEAYLSALVKEPCLGIDRSGNIEYIHPAIQDLLACKPDELIGQSIDLFLQLPENINFQTIQTTQTSQGTWIYGRKKNTGFDLRILPIDTQSLMIQVLSVQPAKSFSKKTLSNQLIKKTTHFYYQNQGLVHQISQLLPYNVFVLDISTKTMSYTNFDWHLNYGYSNLNFSEWEIFFMAIHPEDAEGFRQKFEKWISDPSERLSLKYRFRDKNGKVFWAITRFIPFQTDRQGKLSKVIGIGQDITTQKESIDRLRNSQAYLQALFNSSIENIFLIDRTYQIVWLNKNAGLSSQKFGFPTAKIGDDIRSFVLPGHARYFENNFQKALHGKHTKVEREIIQDNGSSVWLRLTYFPLYNHENQIIGVWMAGLDITAQKEAEKGLITAKQKAESSASFKEQFLSLMSHELRTPLNSVLGICSLLKNTPLNAQQLDYTKILQYSASHLLALINNILDYNRLDVSKLEIEHIDFDLLKLLEEVIEVLKITAQEKGLYLRLQLTKDIPRLVVGDPLRLRQILINLLGNAIKFTQKGEVVLQVSRLENNSQNTDNQLVIFEVCDTGIGIPADKKQIIFERFNQGTADINRKFGGTGLGLAITRKLLEIMGSQIFVESEEGQGSKFYFSLDFPSSRQQHNNLQNLNLSTVPENTPDLKILVAEDNLINQKIITKLLKNWGMQAEVCNSGFEVLEKIKSEDYDLILMDIQMPEISGFETAQQIRSQASDYCQKVPIVALTAHVWAESDNEYELKGMNDYVFKPFEPDDLKIKILRYAQPFKNSRSLQQNKSLSHSISQLANQDLKFKNELNILNIETLSELKTALQQALCEQRIEFFKSAVHKSKISLQIIQATELENMLFQIQKLMLVEPWDWVQLDLLASSITQECERLSQELLAEMNN
ncbi:MAG: ATP-binding protein [Microscillaceae bacterium]|jgi:PAS domain S-box-containing protein|nr:ATP-binding protein [Microscillaceae bacterium]